MFNTYKVEVYGTEYRVGFFVAIHGCIMGDNSNPLFGEIKEIVLNQDVYLYCMKMKILRLDDRLNAYRVEKGEENILIKSEELTDFNKPLSIWRDYKYEEAFLVIRHALL